MKQRRPKLGPSRGISGRCEREIGLRRNVRPGAAVRAIGVAGPSAGPERIVDDGLDGARAPTAFGTAAEATIKLLCATRKVARGAHGIADIMIAKDVAGANDHLSTDKPSVTRPHRDRGARSGMQKEKLHFQAIPNRP